ncbi:MAG: DNA polymerase, partial [Erysipelotrichaceae bacterium]|nr:DNA polymerase [Erysipelotrichaceae bacterium]
LNKMQELSNTIYQYVDTTFNLNSPKQLAEVLFDKLQLPSNKKRSTSQDILEKLIGKHPIIEDILLYRKYSKLYSTYAEGLKKYVGSDLKIHTIYNQVQTATGRLSSTDPNLQNISVKDEESKEIRKAFIASKDSILLSCDYSQIELRMLAHLAKEEKLIDAFKHDLDIHTKTAMDIFHIQETEMTPAYRRAAKAVNFGIIYGMSEFGLSQQIHVSINQAKEFINNYFATYPNIKHYMEHVIQHAVESGYASTILKRRRYIKELKDSNYMMKEFGKRAAMNTPIQGSAADLLKLAMIQIDKKMEGLQSKMILTVHDELIFDVLESEFDQVLAIVLEGMENAMKLSVPLKVSYSKGTSWYDAK